MAFGGLALAGADQNNDGVVDNGVGKQPDAFTVASSLDVNLRPTFTRAKCTTHTGSSTPHLELAVEHAKYR